MYAHQRSAVEVAKGMDSLALLWEPGTGKTLAAIKIAEAWGARRALVVAPLTLLESWRGEWARWADGPHVFSAWDDAGGGGRKRSGKSRGARATAPGAAMDILAVNYERAWRVEEELLDFDADVVILDEAHKIKHHSAKQSKVCHRLGKRTRKRLLLTGTPVSQSPLDVFSLYKFLDPSVFGENWRKFARRYAEFGGYGGYKIVAYRNLDQLAELVHSRAIRVTKADALDLPPTTDRVVPVTLSPPERRAYETMRKHALSAVGDALCSAPMAVTQLLHLQRIAGGHLKTDDGVVHAIGDSKVRALEEIAGELLDADKPVLVFCRFRAEIDAAAAVIPGAEIIDGRASASDRADRVARFQQGQLKALICQTSVGGVGLTLTAADHAIFYSHGYSLTDYEQARARIHRIGQTRPVTYVHLVAQGTADEEVLERLGKKEDLARMVTDDLRDAVRRAAMRGLRVEV